MYKKSFNFLFLLLHLPLPNIKKYTVKRLNIIYTLTETEDK